MHLHAPPCKVLRAANLTCSVLTRRCSVACVCAGSASHSGSLRPSSGATDEM